MAFKILASVVAGLLLVIFIGPVVIKLKDIALSIVVLSGIVMMAIDLWQSIVSGDD